MADNAANDSKEIEAQQMQKEIDKEEKKEGAKPFVKRARWFTERREAVEIVRFRGIVPAKEDSAGRPERIVVQPKSRTYVLDGGANPIALKPGMYSPKKTIAPGKITDEGVAEKVIVLCTVTDIPFPCRIAMPDLDLLGALADEAKALSALSLRTNDGILGGVQLELSLVCDDPLKLLKAFGRPQVKGGTIEETEESAEKKSIWMRLWNWMAGSKEEKEFLVRGIRSITMQDLYGLINFELATSIRASVLRFTAGNLYEKIENRTDVEKDIKRDMATTLADFGMKIDRVSAFQFISPDYDDLLERRSKAAVATQGVVDLKTELTTKGNERELNAEDEMKDKSSKADVNRHGIVEDRATAKAEHEFVVEEQDREHVLDQKDQEHKRDQKRADHALALEGETLDAQQKTEAMKARFGAMLELQNQASDAATDRWLKLLAVVKDANPAIIPYLLNSNPQLVAALANSQGQQQQINAQKEFREALVKVYDQHGEQIHKLLVEGVKQVGGVAAAKVGVDYLRSLQPPPRELKADSGDEESDKAET